MKRRNVWALLLISLVTLGSLAQLAPRCEAAAAHCCCPTTQTTSGCPGAECRVPEQPSADLTASAGDASPLLLISVASASLSTTNALTATPPLLVAYVPAAAPPRYLLDCTLRL